MIFYLSVVRDTVAVYIQKWRDYQEALYIECLDAVSLKVAERVLPGILTLQLPEELCYYW